MKVANDLQNCFTDTIIPLFEILDEIYQKRYAVDPNTKKFIYELKGKQKRRIILANAEEDITTLQSISENIGQRVAFIDYFRYTLKKYGSNIDIGKVKLSRMINEDLDLYKKKVKGIANYENLIPVVSIKDGFKMSKSELIKFIVELKKNSRVALRLTEEYYEEYRDILEEVLENNDFFFFDIEEQSPQVKFIEFEEISGYNIKARIVVLNSPRKTKIKNGAYPDNGYTDLIDNSALESVKEYSFNGFGDYCGLKDTLPSSDKGNNGTGVALVLMYDYSKNSFWSYTNKNTSEGMRGYKKLIPLVLNDRPRFDPMKTCYGYKKVELMPGSGNWSTWHNICASRYISQVYENIK